MIFADKKRWREIFPVSLFANSLGAATDTYAIQHKQLWDYHGDNPLLAMLFDDWGIYLVATYFFIQWLPSKKTWKRMLFYWVLWTSIALGIEYLHIATGHMKYHNGWKLQWSYLCDWVLFTMMYGFHKVFKLEEAYRCLREK